MSYPPRFTVEKELETERLKELPTLLTDRKIPSARVRRKSKQITPAMGLFIEFLREEAKRGKK